MELILADNAQHALTVKMTATLIPGNPLCAGHRTGLLHLTHAAASLGTLLGPLSQTTHGDKGSFEHLPNG